MQIRIMITDDHAVFRSGLGALLAQEDDMEVVAQAGTGRETLALLEEHEVDVLILDMSMPGMPGSRVAENVLARHPGLAIVVLTMHEEEHYVQEMFRIGARGFVFKKSTGTELINAIRTVHGGGRYLDTSLVDQAISTYTGTVPRKKTASRLELLTPREQEVCRWLALGHTNAEIGKRLYISERTVQVHRRNIMTKLDLKGRAQLVSFAMDNGLFDPMK